MEKERLFSTLANVKNRRRKNKRLEGGAGH
jgi:hypothetical protein